MGAFSLPFGDTKGTEFMPLECSLELGLAEERRTKKLCKVRGRVRL